MPPCARGRRCRGDATAGMHEGTQVAPVTRGRGRSKPASVRWGDVGPPQLETTRRSGRRPMRSRRKRGLARLSILVALLVVLIVAASSWRRHEFHARIRRVRAARRGVRRRPSARLPGAGTDRLRRRRHRRAPPWLPHGCSPADHRPRPSGAHHRGSEGRRLRPAPPAPCTSTTSPLAHALYARTRTLISCLPRTRSSSRPLTALASGEPTIVSRRTSTPPA